MITYKEFLDGTSSYRRKVEKTYNEREAEAYELARSANELEILRLSQTRDHKDLARILTYLDTLVTEVDESSPQPSQDCIRLGAILTYFKIIAQESGYSATLLDQIYGSDNIVHTTTTGGLLFILKPDREGLPILRCKVPIESTPDRIRTIVHETFVAYAALNPLRRDIPSFAYVYAFWECGHLVQNNETLTSGLCNSPGIRPVMIYEYNPGARTLCKYMQDDSRTIGLENVLDYLLQLMGALQFASDYADYTHYDLHSGNVLVQPQDEDLVINFQGYVVTTRERVIIIDNGLAYCSYEVPNTLRRGSSRLPNSDAIELFGTSDRLRASTLRDYGSIHNSTLGVQRDRSYPLSDIFRIFFDIYSLCSRDVQRELMPLVGVFFKDPEHIDKIEGDLPPIREEMFRYQYGDFAREILRIYKTQISKFVKPRALWLGISASAPGIRLDQAFNWRIVNPNYIPTTYEIGMISLLDNSLTLGEPPVETAEYTLKKVRHLEGTFLYDVLYGTEWRQMKEFDEEEVDLERILSSRFFDSYVDNLRMCVDHVMWIRAIYSNSRVLFFALKKMGYDDALDRIAKALEVQPSELQTLATYCKKARLPSYSKEAFEDMMKLTQKIENAIAEGGTETERDCSREQSSLINSWYMVWYRACLPGIKINLNFGLQWGNPSPSFGELSLPDIQSP